MTQNFKYNFGKYIAALILLGFLFYIDVFVLPNPITFAGDRNDGEASYNFQLLVYWIIRIVGAIFIILFVIGVWENLDALIQNRNKTD